MQEEHPSQFDSKPAGTGANDNQADKEWSELQRDLDTLGRQLAELSTHTAQLGEHFLASLQARFEEVKARALTYRQATEQQVEQMRLTATSQAESTFADMRARSTEAAKQAWERAEPLRQGAKDVGEGLARAWGELRASFGKAAGRLQSESTSSQANGPAPSPSEDRRETT